MLIQILIFAVVALVGFLVYIALKPGACTISREIFIKARPETLFPFINNSKKMNDWMPWQDSDPGVQMQYSGPEDGVGSKSSWKSNGKMGVGNAVVIESVPNKSVKTQLTYTKPMDMLQLAEVTLTANDDGTKVKWSVDGHNRFLFRLMGVIMNVEKMVGGEFEKGLAKLKITAEAINSENKMKINPELDLVLERVVDVPLELIWKAWTTPEHITKWFTPAPWKTTKCTIDLRSGGLFHTIMQSPEGQNFPCDGCYLEIIPNKKLIWTDALGPGFRPTIVPGATPEQKPFYFTAVILLEAHGTGTKYTAIGMHSNSEGRKKHEEMGFLNGWGIALDQLVAHVKNTMM